MRNLILGYIQAVLILFLMMSGALLVSCEYNNTHHLFSHNSDSVTQIHVSHIKRSFNQYGQEVQKLATLADAENFDKELFRHQVATTRLAYKQIEFMAEYYYPEHVKAYINGPPLKHLDPYPYREIELPTRYYDEGSILIPPLDYQEENAFEKPERRIVNPQGLQVLDELAFSDEAIEQQDVAQLSEQLQYRTTIMVQAINKRRYIEDYQILEAIRLQLIRIFTLGVTGFDTPGSLNALNEANASLNFMQEIVTTVLQELIKGPLGGPANPEYAVDDEELTTLFNQGQKQLAKSSFDNFDRLAFLTQIINPLYEKIAKIHETASLPYRQDLDFSPQAWNSKSLNIFSEDLLDPYFYTQLTTIKDNAALADLGSILFQDKQLSQNKDLSCASCHQAKNAFTDGLAKSRGNRYHSIVKRNAPTLVNAVYSVRYFYDLRAFSLEDQIQDVINNPLEFNMDLKRIEKKLNQSPRYQRLFSETFDRDQQSGDQTISSQEIVSALSSYIVSLRSMQSDFDQFVRGELGQLPNEAKQGFNLFMGKAACGTCHFAPTFSGLVPPLFAENESEVLGVLAKPGSFIVDSDTGRSANGVFLENQDIYRHAFKTTTVRNVELTAPYFHNGAYASLEEVIDFYDKGGAQGLGLHYEVPNQTLADSPLELTDKEKQSIKAFLLSLTDRKAVQAFTEQEQSARTFHTSQDNETNKVSIGIR